MRSGKEKTAGTYTERFESEWKATVSRLKGSGANLRRIRITGVERNYAGRK